MPEIQQALINYSKNRGAISEEDANLLIEEGLIHLTYAGLEPTQKGSQYLEVLHTSRQLKQNEAIKAERDKFKAALEEILSRLPERAYLNPEANEGEFEAIKAIILKAMEAV